MEFALLIPLVLIVVMMIVEVGLAARLQIELTAAAREGARVAATTPDPAAALAAVNQALGDRGRDTRINVHRPHVVGAQATVEITLRHHVSLPLLGRLAIPLTARATMRVER